MKSTRYLQIVVIAGLCAGLFGCGPSRGENLQKRVESYWRSLQWRAPGSAAQLVEAKSRSRFMQTVGQRMGTTRVTNFAVTNLAFKDKNKTKAQVLVQYEYYQLGYENVVTVQETQDWIYSEKDRDWVLVLPPPAPKTLRAKGTKK